MKRLLFSLISIFSFITLVGSQRGLYDRIFEEQKKRNFEDSLFFQTEEDPSVLSNYFLYGNPSERFKRLYQFPLSIVRQFLKEEQEKRRVELDAYPYSQIVAVDFDSDEEVEDPFKDPVISNSVISDDLNQS